MLRISGINLPNEKRLVVALTYIYGIGMNNAKQIMSKLKLEPELRVKDLPEETANILRNVIEKEYAVEGTLRREVFGNIKRMKEIRCYRGIRHSKGLPCRGQKTKTNSRTVRGNTRKTMGSGRKPSGLKT
jgi:small subunit ribosomal protein S13